MYEVPDGLPTLSRESHHSDSGFACVMEYISVITGDVWTDHPECTEPIIATVAIGLNDAIHDDNQRGRVLVPRIGRLIGTAMTDASEKKRFAYRRRLASQVRLLKPGFFDHRMTFSNGDSCGCPFCESSREQKLHAVVNRTINSLTTDHDECFVIGEFTVLLDRLLDIADDELGRTRRDTETAEKLMVLRRELMPV